MSHIPFFWNETSRLATELSIGIVRASLMTLAEQPHMITLWRRNETGIRISSKMHDIEGWTEIGALEFCMVNNLSTNEKEVNLDSAFSGKNRVVKLIISERNMTVESGIIVEAPNGKRIVVVAGAFPYSLAIKGAFSSIANIFNPEYEPDRYKQVQLP